MTSSLGRAVTWSLPLSILLATATLATVFRYEAIPQGRMVLVVDRWKQEARLCVGGGGDAQCRPYLAAGMMPLPNAAPKPRRISDADRGGSLRTYFRWTSSLKRRVCALPEQGLFLRCA